MSIATKTGDKGTTGLLYGTRVHKADRRINAVGDIDELSAALGLAKSTLRVTTGVASPYFVLVTTIQETLTYLMGEVSCEADKREAYKNRFNCLQQEDLDRLDKEIGMLEDMPATKQTDWVLYGNSPIGATFDLASKVCRRAERSYLSLNFFEPGLTLDLSTGDYSIRILVVQYLNRLSDLLHLIARYFDHIQN